MKPIKWQVLLPVVGLDLESPQIVFASFIIQRRTLSELKSEYDVNLNESLWANTVIEVGFEGKEVNDNCLCESCPRHSTLQVRHVEVFGKMMEVEMLPRAKCICASVEGSKSQIDVIGNALPLLEDALSLIRLFRHISSRGSLPAHCIISLQRLPHYSEVVGIKNNQNGYSENLVMGTRKYGVPLSQKDIELWSEHYNFELFSHLVHESYFGYDLDELDEIMISSLVMFGSMLEEVSLRDCFLRGSIAVETLTNAAPGNGQISAKFRELGATLTQIALHPELINMSSSDVTEQMRRSWIDARTELSLIYKQRCHISHGSERIAKSNEEKLYHSQKLLVQIALGAIVLFKEHRFSKTQFYTALNHCKQLLTSES